MCAGNCVNVCRAIPAYDWYRNTIDAWMCQRSFVSVCKTYAIFFYCRTRRCKLPARRPLTATTWQEDKVATTLQADRVARQGCSAGILFIVCRNDAIHILNICTSAMAGTYVRARSPTKKPSCARDRRRAPAYWPLACRRRQGGRKV